MHLGKIIKYQFEKKNCLTRLLLMLSIISIP